MKPNLNFTLSRSSRSQMFYKIGGLKNSEGSQENTCAGVCG